MKSRRATGSLGLPFAVFPALGWLLLAAGCADVTGDALQQDVSQLRQDVNALKVSAHRARGEAEAINQLERRSRDQSTDTTRQLNLLSTRLEAVSAELNRVSTRLDDVSRRLDTWSRPSTQSRPPAGSIAAPPPVSAPVVPAPPASALRVTPPAAPLPPAAVPPPAARATPPSTSSTAPAPPPAVAPPATTAPAVAAPPPPAATRVAPPPTPGRPVAGAAPEQSYQAAYLDFSRGRYELAMTGFREFLRRYPDSPLADSAQYGIGESYYSMASAATAQGQTDKATRALEQSVQEFRKVIVIYPRGARVPPALYKEALALTELKQTGLARSRLQYLVDHFPQSEEAPLAKERLAALKQ
jgi:tol-pal system protein YbgF